MTAVVAMAITVGACGSGSSGSGGSSSSSSGLSAATQKAVDAAYKGSFGTPPSSGPKAQPGKDIWLITSSAQATDFHAPGQILDAAKALGWNVTVFDGQFNPDTWVSGVRQAIAAKADGIILFTVDCVAVKAGLEDAKKAGIPVVGFESIDCDQTVDENGVIRSTGQPGLFDATNTYDNPESPDKPLTFPEFIYQVVYPYNALGVIGGTDGKAKLVKLKETDFPILLAGDRGFDRALGRYCPDCEIAGTVEFVGSDIGSALQQKVSQALAQHPDANSVQTEYDAAAQNAAPAVLASGRKDSIFVMGGEGTAPVVELIREGRGVNAGVAFSVKWEAWAALDAMNRLLNGEKPRGAGFPSGMGAQLFDRDQNMPPKGQAYQPPVDYEAAYKKAWGVGGS